MFLVVSLMRMNGKQGKKLLKLGGKKNTLTFYCNLVCEKDSHRGCKTPIFYSLKVQKKQTIKHLLL